MRQAEHADGSQIVSSPRLVAVDICTSLLEHSLRASSIRLVSPRMSRNRFRMSTETVASPLASPTESLSQQTSSVSREQTVFAILAALSLSHLLNDLMQS